MYLLWNGKRYVKRNGYSSDVIWGRASAKTYDLGLIEDEGFRTIYR